MATVKGPLFSIGASGTIAGAVVYSTWKGRPYVRQHAVPANPRSVSQVSMRAMMRFLSQYWDSLSGVDQATWETRAAATNISPFNAFISRNQSRWGRGDLPLKTDIAEVMTGHGGMSGHVATAGIRSVKLDFDIDALQSNWGVAIYRSIVANPTCIRNELVQVVPAESLATFDWLDVGLTPGVLYYYNFQSFSDTASPSGPTGAVNATPTA